MALIKPEYLDAVVMLGAKTGNATAPYQWRGSAFFFSDRRADNKTYDNVLVTNRHVLKGFYELGVDDLHLLVNTTNSPGPTAVQIPLTDAHVRSMWHVHPNDEVDVAIMPINGDELIKKGYQLYSFNSDTDSKDIARLKSDGVSEGNFIYTLGYPEGMQGGRRMYVTVRGGVIARIRDAYAGESDRMVMDMGNSSGSDVVIASRVLPGNSGGPVILKPEADSFDGKGVRIRSALIGIVTGYVNAYQGEGDDVKKLHSGLASVEPVDRIREVVSAWRSGRAPRFMDNPGAMASGQHDPDAPPPNLAGKSQGDDGEQDIPRDGA